MIEKKTAKTILQKPKKINVGKKSFYVKPPTVATMVQVSELVAELPKVDLKEDSSILSEVLNIAKDVGVVGSIAATLILGAKRNYNLIGRIRIGLLAEYVNYKLTISETKNLIIDLLKEMEVIDFFGLITSLNAVNLLKETREVTETIQSGPSSQGSPKATT